MNRYRPNEPTSPVSLDLLALLMRADDPRISQIVLELSEERRAALAVYCFARAHMRALGLRIARDCGGDALWAAGGTMGRSLAEQAEHGGAFDVGPSQWARKKVTLAKFAA